MSARRGLDPGSHARILEVYGPAGQEPLRVERYIAAANDGGRWTFETSGDPFDFERLDHYKKSAKSARFDQELLYRYLRSLGVPIDREPNWADAIVLFRD